MKKYLVLFIGAFLAVLLLVYGGRAAIQSVAGLAVAQSNTRWNNLKDIAAGTTGISTGVGMTAPCIYNGTTCDAWVGTAALGGRVQVMNTPAVTTPVSGAAFFAITKTNLTTASSNQAFGFTSKKVSITAPSTNTANVCFDWVGGTAVCPAADTAGDDVLAAGTAILLDDYAVTSVSAIAASGTQTVIIRAWN